MKSKTAQRVQTSATLASVKVNKIDVQLCSSLDRVPIYLESLVKLVN